MIVAANWKMNIGFQKATDFIYQFKNQIDIKKDKDNFIFFPPVCLAGLFQTEIFHWGGQNVYHQTQGAFTGETSAQTLKEMGAQFCLLGHNERRSLFGESDAEIEKKFSILMDTALMPLLCIGETKSHRFNKQKILKNQMSWIKKYDKVPQEPNKLPQTFQDTPFIVAYEPVWSIGTGKTPPTQEIDETAQFIKEYLTPAQVKVFYGGSVDSTNLKNFLYLKSIDGFLIGGASLDPKELYTLYQKISENK